MSFRSIHSICVALLALSLLLASCATYNNQVSDYYAQLRKNDYEKAARALDKNKLLKKDRNRLLYLLERGKISHLLHQWDSSNRYFNEADRLMEDARTSVKDVVAGTLMNPMMQTYKAEDFEKYLVHYYKALNYLHLNQPDEALVEARRISLRTRAQEDKTGNKNKYDEDAFSYTLQGMIYEKAGDINNAFIAYRNAADVYLENKGSYYGTPMPEQLKKDLLRMARQNGFADEEQRYETLLNTRYTGEETPAGGELILFWENGSAPVKAQQDIWFSLVKNNDGHFFFSDAAGLYNIPFDASSGYSGDHFTTADLRSFRVALPKYEVQPLVYTGAVAELNNLAYPLEAAEDINTLAFTTLRERMLKELSGTLTRLAVKKLAEAAVRPDEKKEDDKKKTEEEKKKEEKKRNQREALAFGLQLFSLASEKADTRNWQSLPHTVYYARIPLRPGENKLLLRINGGSSPAVPVSVTGTGRLQFLNLCTPH